MESKASRETVKVSVIETNPLFLEGYLHLLTTHHRIEVLDYGTSAKEVYERINGTPPDVVLMNIESAYWDATEFWLRVQGDYGKTRLIVNDRINPGPLVKLMLRSGISSYFIKDQVSQNELLEIIFNTYRQGYSATSIVSETMIDELREEALFIQQVRAEMSDREYEVLRMICDGLNRRQISRKLSITESTVKFHLDKLRQRYNCDSVLQLAVQSIKNGIVDAVLVRHTSQKVSNIQTSGSNG